MLEPGDLFTIDGDASLYMATEWDSFNETMRHAIVNPQTLKVVIPFSGGIIPRFARLVDQREGVYNRGYEACKPCSSRPGYELIPREEIEKVLRARGDDDAGVAAHFDAVLTAACDLCGKKRRLYSVRDA